MCAGELPNGDREPSSFDWNHQARNDRRPITLQDETLRDGIQSPSARDPSIERKIALLYEMEALGIDVINVGLPASGARNRDDSLALCREIARGRLRIRPAAAGRTVVSDVEAIVDISQRAGIAVEVCTFIGSSPIRQYAEAWDLARLSRHSADAIDVGVKAGLEVCYVTEDTTRARPETLSALFSLAIARGARRLCLADTVGHATPDGVRNLIDFTRGVIAATGAADIGIDWHGHNDRGLGLDNALAAVGHGADRVHGTALGIGERVGNAPMELLLLNLSLGGVRPAIDRASLEAYCDEAAAALGWKVPLDHPIIGGAVRTARASVPDRASGTRAIA
jgi:2-isopropylmalate synthase